MTNQAEITVTTNVKALAVLARLITSIDHAKGFKTQQDLITTAHDQVINILGQHAHLVYQPEDMEG